MKLEKNAFAKINLGLDVTGKRDDGYHIVRMIMQNVNIYDTLTFEDNDTGEIILTANSPKIPTAKSRDSSKKSLVLPGEPISTW